MDINQQGKRIDVLNSYSGDKNYRAIEPAANRTARLTGLSPFARVGMFVKYALKAGATGIAFKVYQGTNRATGVIEDVIRIECVPVEGGFIADVADGEQVRSMFLLGSILQIQVDVEGPEGSYAEVEIVAEVKRA